MTQKLKKRRTSHTPVPVSKFLVFWRRFVRSFKMSLRFIFSHIGLTGSVVAYSILGGWIFMGLEAPHERQLRDQITSIRGHYVTLILNASETSDHADNYLANITYKYITEFEKEIVHFIDDTGWNGLGDERELQWSYAGALLYSVTVITTIGEKSFFFYFSFIIDHKYFLFCFVFSCLFVPSRIEWLILTAYQPT